MNPSDRSPVFFRDVNLPPPGGFFFEYAGERARGPTFVSIEPAVRGIMRRHGIPGTPEMAVAAYMCPKLDDPGRYCRGPVVPEMHTTAAEAMANSVKYCSRNVVPFDRIARREAVCLKCPKHRRHWCPTCTGHPDRIRGLMGGRRPDIPEDRLSGVCECAKAYEYAVASVEYAADEPIWSGAPETCWRRRDV